MSRARRITAFVVALGCFTVAIALADDLTGWQYVAHTAAVACLFGLAQPWRPTNVAARR